MKTLFINILLLSCIQIYGQITVDTQLSVKDSIIIITLQNESNNKVILINKTPFNRESGKGSEVKFYFIVMNNDTVNTYIHSYGDEAFLQIHPEGSKKLRYFILNKINFQEFASIKVVHNIDYLIVLGVTSGRMIEKLENYREEVIFDLRKVLQTCNGTKIE